MRPFKKTKRVITRAENLTMHEQAQASAEKLRLDREQKEQLVAEGKLRREIVHVDSRTTIIRYLPIDEENNNK
jgi:hypothetical protein